MTDVNEKFWDTAFDVVRRFRDFDSYGSREKAIKALRRRSPGVDAQRCESAFQEALRLYEAADLKLKQRWELLLRDNYTTEYDNPAIREMLGAVTDDLRNQFSDLPASVCSSAVSWLWFWHIVK